MFGRRYVREGRWKAVHIPPPTGSGRWELFDIEADPGEVNNMARSNPEQLAKMVKDWNSYATDKGVVLPVIPGN
jgi:arylsulfatase